jgi:hypothetical protein
VSNDTLEITHIEIRRVQNGFIIAGLNTNMRERYGGIDDFQRVTMVADSEEQLCNVLKGILAGIEVHWLPTNEFDMLNMRQRVKAMNEGSKVAPAAPAP